MPLSAGLATLLRAVRTNQLRTAGCSLVPPWIAGDFVFDRGDGRAARNLTRSARRPEGTRSSWAGRRPAPRPTTRVASMLVANGTNVRTVADILGHSTVAFTLGTYVHPDEERRQSQRSIRSSGCSADRGTGRWTGTRGTTSGSCGTLFRDTGTTTRSLRTAFGCGRTATPTTPSSRNGAATADEP